MVLSALLLLATGAAASPLLAARGLSPSGVAVANYGPDLAYTVQLKVGTPAQTLTFIVDTGSADLWVLSSAVAGSTGSSSPGFNSAHSSSFALNSAAGAFDDVYASGEAQGQWANDVVCLGTQCVRQAFGLIDTPIGFSFAGTPIAGILGLDFGQPLVAQTQTPLWQQLAANWNDKQFGLGLSRGPTNYFAAPFSSAGKTGSTLTLGGTNTALYTGSINYISVPSTTDFWRVPLDGVNVGTSTVATGVYGSPLWAAFDSGSATIAGYPSSVDEIYAQIPGAWLSPQGYAVPCDNVSPGSTAGVPSLGISFQLGGQSYALADADAIQFAVPSAFFAGQGVTPPGNTQQWCIGSVQAYSPWPATLPPAFILGTPFLKNWYSAYRSSPPAIGLAKSR